MTRVVTAHVPDEIAEQLDSYAEQLDRSRGWIVKQALKSWLEWEDEKSRLSLEALEESERIGTIPQDEVVAYFRSRGTDSPLPRPKPRKS